MQDSSLHFIPRGCLPAECLNQKIRSIGEESAQDTTLGGQLLISVLCPHVHTQLNNPIKGKASSAPRHRDTGQPASPEKLSTYLPVVSLLTSAHPRLHVSLQFHRKCELSTVCDGGELKDHILLPTSICPVTRVSDPAPTRALAFPGSGVRGGQHSQPPIPWSLAFPPPPFLGFMLW